MTPWWMPWKPCPVPAATRFLHHDGAVESRRREDQERTHDVVECECGGWHVLRHVQQMRGAA